MTINEAGSVVKKTIVVCLFLSEQGCVGYAAVSTANNKKQHIQFFLGISSSDVQMWFQTTKCRP